MSIQKAFYAKIIHRKPEIIATKNNIPIVLNISFLEAPYWINTKIPNPALVINPANKDPKLNA